MVFNDSSSPFLLLFSINVNEERKHFLGGVCGCQLGLLAVLEESWCLNEIPDELGFAHWLFLRLILLLRGS